jgi:hypothetical protein
MIGGFWDLAQLGQQVRLDTPDYLQKRRIDVYRMYAVSRQLEWKAITGYVFGEKC